MGLLGEAAGAASGLIGMIGQKKREKRQHKRQLELMNKQQEAQRGLNQQGADLAYQMWKDTNYSAQMDEMRKAGLNVGMMYGGAGGAGGTTSAGSGGSAAGGSAAMSQGMPEMMGIDQTIAMRRLENETKLADSQVKLNESKAGLQDAQTTTEKGKIENMLGGENDILKEQLVTNWYNRELATTDEVKNRASLLWEQANQQNKQNEITTQTMESVVKEINLGAIRQELENELTKSRKTLTDEQTDKTINEIYNMWVNTGIQGVGKVMEGIGLAKAPGMLKLLGSLKGGKSVNGNAKGQSVK